MPLAESDDPKYARLQWRTATASGGGDCVQVARTENEIAVRDSKNPDGGLQLHGRTEWAGFVVRVRTGDFDPRRS
jgi:Domain of unknown function (DUF397)